MLSQIETLLNVMSVLVVTFLAIMLGWNIWLLRHGSTIKTQFSLFFSLAYIALTIIEIGYLIIFILDKNLKCVLTFAYIVIFLYFAIYNMLTFKCKRTQT